MAPVITLTTDFGEAGPYVAVMKAVIRQHAPQANVVDLSHHVAPCQPGEAGFWLARRGPVTGKMREPSEQNARCPQIAVRLDDRFARSPAPQSSPAKHAEQDRSR